MTTPDSWGNDPLSKFLDDQIQGMPDRPKFVIVLLNQKRNLTSEFGKVLDNFKTSFLSLIPINALEIKYVAFSYGFEDASAELMGKFLGEISTAKFDEGAIYVNGVARMRIAPTLRAPEASNQ